MPSRSPYTASLSAPSATEMVGAPGGLAQHGDRGLDPDRTEIRIVDGEEGAASHDVFVVQQLLGVVDGRGGDLGGEELRHRLVEGAVPHPGGDERADLVAVGLLTHGVDVVGVGGQILPAHDPEHPHRHGR